MPNITFKDKKITVKKGTNLRKALLYHRLSPHNASSQYLNCKGLGSCGTCAIEISGELPPLTTLEKWRLSFPPHKKESPLRLACQIKVNNDLTIKKHDGFWGHLLCEDQ